MLVGLIITSCDDSSLHSAIGLMRLMHWVATRTFLLFFFLLFRPQVRRSQQPEKIAERGNVLGLLVASLITFGLQVSSRIHHECNSHARGNSRKLRSNPSYIIKSINFGDFPKLVEDNVRKYHDAHRQPALLATVSPSTAKHTAVAFMISC